MSKKNKIRMIPNMNYRRNKSVVKKAAGEIGIIGLSKILDSSNSLVRRSIWLILLTAMTTLCVWQLYKCLSLFFSNPVIKQVDIIRSNYVYFPAIYLCSTLSRNLAAVVLNQNESCPNGTFTCWEHKEPYEDQARRLLSRLDSGNFTTGKTKIDEIEVYKMCGEQGAKCEADGVRIRVNQTVIETMLGKCYLLDTADKIPYRGPFTHIKLKFEMGLHGLIQENLRYMLTETNDTDLEKAIEESLDKPRVGASISLHNSAKDNRHHLLFLESQDFYVGFETHLLLHQKEYKFLNRSQLVCDNEDRVMECINQCIESNLSKICSPLYYNVSNAPQCRWDRTFIDLQVHNFKVYSKLDLAACKCPRICHEFRYTMYPNVIKQLCEKDESKLVINIYFGSSNLEQTTERSVFE